jgi:hypothetical protein
VNKLPLEAILSKTGESWVVGGVASNFFKDLDGDAISPDAIQQAIPGFMANRGPDGIQGGPLRLHHGFWERFLKQAINGLNLPYDEQMKLITAIALPLGRVTEMTVDSDGTTRWRGLLSQANPIARVIWDMLREGMIHLGVSVGGKINAVRPGRDALGRPCNVITSVRLDELSITDNPANRLIESEAPDNGAYIMALAKSLEKAARKPIRENNMEHLNRFLAKALGGSPGKEIGSGSWKDTTTGMGRGLGAPTSQRPRGSKQVQMDNSSSAHAGKGIGGKQPKATRPYSSGGMPPTDVWGMTMTQLTRELSKCCSMGKDAWGSPETVGFLTDSAHAIAGITDSPNPELINFVRFLQNLGQFAQALPHMDDYQAKGTVVAMNEDLFKALDEFVEKLPSELKGRPLRPPGSPGVVGMDIQFPKQYVVYS